MEADPRVRLCSSLVCWNVEASSHPRPMVQEVPLTSDTKAGDLVFLVVPHSWKAVANWRGRGTEWPQGRARGISNTAAPVRPAIA